MGLLPLALSCEEKEDIQKEDNQSKDKSSPRIWSVSTDVNNFSYTQLEYESGKLKSFTGTLGNYLVYYKNDTIHHILEPRTSFNSFFSRRSWIFTYENDKKLSKVYVKKREDFDASLFTEEDPFWSDENDGKAILKDSLVYSSTDQLLEIHDLFNQVITTFLYDSSDAEVPSKIIDFMVGETYTTTLTYLDMEQPGVRDLWFFAFTDFVIPAMPLAHPTFSERYSILHKKCVKSFINEQPNYYYISPVFTYSFNSDSTIFSGRTDPEQLSYHFSYSFTKK